MNPELCVPEELAHMVCSNSNCRMSMFLLNELVADDRTSKQMTKSELNERITYSRFWKIMKRSKPTSEVLVRY